MVNEEFSTCLGDFGTSSEVSSAIIIIVFTRQSYRRDGTRVLCEPTIIARVRAFSSLTIRIVMGPSTFAHEDQIEYRVDVIMSYRIADLRH